MYHNSYILSALVDTCHPTTADSPELHRLGGPPSSWLANFQLLQPLQLVDRQSKGVLAEVALQLAKMDLTSRVQLARICCWSLTPWFV